MHKIQLRAALRLQANPEVIAPAESFRPQNERELQKQQDSRKSEQDRAVDQEPTPSKSKLHMGAWTPKDADDLSRAAEVQFASRLTSPLGRALRTLAAMIGPEDDPLTHGQRNSGAGPAVEADSTVDTDNRPGTKPYIDYVSMGDSYMAADDGTLDESPAIGNPDLDGCAGSANGTSECSTDAIRSSAGPSTANDETFEYEAIDGLLNEDQPDATTADADPRLFNIAQQPLG